MNSFARMILDRVEAKWKYVAYDPKADKIWLVGDLYHCLDTKADWYDIEDGDGKLRTNCRRIRKSKTRDWVYICRK